MKSIIFAYTIGNAYTVKILNFIRSSHPHNFIKKETLGQVFSCEFCEISKSTFSFRTTPVTASILRQSSFLVFLVEAFQFSKFHENVDKLDKLVSLSENKTHIKYY